MQASERVAVDITPKAVRSQRRMPLELISVIGAFFIWFMLTNTIVPPLIFPSPQAVFGVVQDQYLTILMYTGATLSRVLVGFVIGSAYGVLNGVSLHMNPTLGRIADPLVEIVRPIPPIAMMPFIIIWFGIGDLGKILLVAGGCSMVLYINTIEAIRHVNPVFVHAARSLGADKRRIYRTIVVPAILPAILSGLRVALALSFSLTIAAEFMGAQSGLGFMIMLASRYLDTPSIVTGVIIIGAVSLGMDAVVRSVGRHLLRWSPRASSW